MPTICCVIPLLDLPGHQVNGPWVFPCWTFLVSRSMALGFSLAGPSWRPGQWPLGFPLLDLPGHPGQWPLGFPLLDLPGVQVNGPWVFPCWTFLASRSMALGFH